MTIAGSDCSAGAGIQADCRTFERLGVYGICAVTAVVAQSPGNVSLLEHISEEVFAAQLSELSGAFPIGAAKTGLLPSLPVLERTIEFFENHPEIPLVIDPVLRSGSGTGFVEKEVREKLSRGLFRRAALVTPNLPEAEEILGLKITNAAGLQEAAVKFYEKFGCNALVKGGHLQNHDGKVSDVLCLNGEIEVLEDVRLDVPDLHGTGCTLSAAIAAGLARGLSLRDAVLAARKNLRVWMKHHHSWDTIREVHAIGIDVEE